MGLLAPVSFVVIKVYGSRIGIADDGVAPARQLDAISSRFSTEQLHGSMNRFVYPHASTSGSHGDWITNLSLD